MFYYESKFKIMFFLGGRGEWRGGGGGGARVSDLFFHKKSNSKKKFFWWVGRGGRLGVGIVW